jgi:hypothetical protein
MAARRARSVPPDEAFPAMRKRKGPPHAFVLEALETASPYTRPMFGSIAVYIETKIVLILRDRPSYPADNGVWLATIEPHHESLRCEFPYMRSIGLFGTPVTSWQVLPVDSPDFEEAALRACELILAKDPRIGKVPKSRRAAKHPVL